MQFRPFLITLWSLLIPLGAVAETVVPATTYPAAPPVVVPANSDLTTGTNQVIVSDGATVNFISTSKITLGPGFYAAQGANFSATIGVLPQTIPLDPQGSVNLTQGQYALPPLSASGLPITYTFDNPSVISGIDGSGNVTLIGAGQVKITATQAGNGTYASTSVSQILTVLPPGTAGGNANGFVTLVTFTTPSGVPSEFTCKVQQGDGTNWLSSTVYTSVKVTASSRDVTVSTYTGDLTTLVAQSSCRYADQDWGTEEMTSSTVAGLTTDYAYYTTSTNKGSYRRLKSVTEPTGNWVAYQYSDLWDNRGQITAEYRPFLDSPASVGFVPTTGRVITYDYQLSWTGRKTRPFHREEKINGTTVAYTTYEAADTPSGNGFWATEGTKVIANRNGTLTQTSTNSNFRADQGSEAPGRPSYSIGADGTKTSFNDGYGGAYNFSTHTLSQPGNPIYFRTLAAHGSSTNADGTATLITKYDDNTLLEEQQLSSIWMTPNKSTIDICIYDNANHKLREETRIFRSDGTFALVSWTDYTYDSASRMLSSTSSNGTTTSNTYTNGLLTSSTDASGQTLTYTYDIAGRPVSVTKHGMSGQTYPIVTINTYDGAGRITKTVAGGLLTASKQYDLAGRVISSTVPGGTAGYTTGYGYDLGGRQVTVTPPGSGGTVITETYADGSSKSVSGTGVIAQTYTHVVESTASYVMKHTSYPTGFPASATVTYCDMMGSPVEQRSPGYNGGAAIVQTSEYNPKGQLVKTTQTGAPAMLYEYDVLGRMKRQGSHIDGGATLTLASNDRITEQDSYFSTPDNGATWYAIGTKSVYAASNYGVAKLVSKTETQLNNFPAPVGTTITLAKSTVTDIYGNTTVSTTKLDQTNKTVTTTTKASDSNIPAESVTINGLLQSSKDTSGITTTYGYDTLGRPITVTDAQNRTVTTTYMANSSEVYKVTDAAGVNQQVYNYDGAGRVSVVAAPNPNYGIVANSPEVLSTRYGYDIMGRKVYEWGESTVPVEIVYDDRGRQWKMKTFAKSTANFKGTGWPSDAVATATTTWEYDANTGLLKKKIDDQNHTISFAYTAENKLWTKTNARNQVTTYAYSSTTGELTDESYSNDLTYPTPIHYDYNRLGQTKGVTDAAGTRIFTYNSYGTLELQQQDFTVGDFAGQRSQYVVEPTIPGAKGRPIGIGFGTTTVLNQAVNYGYQLDGRLSTVTARGNVYTYTYKANSHLIEKGTLDNYTDTRGYESQHDWSKSRSTTYGTGTTPPVLASFNHTFDQVGRITATAKTGVIFNPYAATLVGLSTAYTYSDRDEVTGEKTFVTSGAALPGRDNGGVTGSPGFDYDNMGNRKTTNHNGVETGYTTNSLNQYTNVAVPGIYDVSRFTTQPLGSISVSGTAGTQGTPASPKAGNYFFNSYNLDNTLAGAATGVFATLTVNDGLPSPPSIGAYLPPRTFTITYDDDGNMLNDGKWLYTYNLKNELVSIETSGVASSALAPKKKFNYFYDYLGRRVKKLTYDWNGSAYVANSAKEERYLYDGWNLAVVLNSSNVMLRNYVWGLDLSGTMQGAGGVGGLLTVEDFGGYLFLPAYDTNGNIHGLVTYYDITFPNGLSATAGSLVASYEYDAFGKTVREDGPYASGNPFRYSTKYTDAETDLVYYGLRYYSPKLGRFINTDPIEEAGGVNLYAFCGNNAISGSDYLGMGPWDDVPPSVNVSLYYPGLFNPTSTNAYRDFLAYANSGFGSSGSSNFSFSFSGGGYLPNYYLPSTARPGGTVYAGGTGPTDRGTSHPAPPDPAGVGNKTNASLQKAIATNTGSTNVAGGSNAPTSGDGFWTGVWKGAVQGDFAENTGWGGVVGQVGVGLIPIAGQIADARDTIAAIKGFGGGGWKRWGTYGNLAAVGIAWVPGMDWVKGGKNIAKQSLQAAESTLAHKLAQTGAGNFSGSADEAYEAIRASTNDIAEIAANTGLKPANVAKVKNHVFMQEHLLDRYAELGVPGYMGRFDSDIGIAQAWQRLRSGTYKADDMQLLRHEAAEAWFMRKYGPSYNAAHNAAEARFPAPK